MKRIRPILSLGLLILPLLAAGQDLPGYQKIAAENNPGLRAKYKAFEAALEKVAQQSSLPDPTLSLGYFIAPVETRVGPQQARFSLRQMFPWFGTLEAQEKAAALRAEAQYQAFLDARNQLYYRVAEAYYPLYELGKHRQLEQENRRLLASYKRLANSRYENGKTSMVDVLRVEIRLEESQTNLSILKQKKKPLETQFNLLLNRAPDTPIQLPDTLEVTPRSPGYGKDSLFTGHPLLAEVALKQEASKAQEKAAQRQGLPQLGLGLDYALIAPRADVRLPDNGQDALMPMLSLSLPIFRGKYQAAQREAQLKQEQYRLQKAARANELLSAYEKAFFEMQRQLEIIDLQETQIRTSKQSRKLLITAYRHAGSDFEEVLRMQQQILRYKKQKASAFAQYHLAQAKLEYLTAKPK